MKKRSIITLVVVFGALFVGLLIFIGVLVAVFDAGDLGEPDEAVGVVEIEGAIEESKETLEDIERWEEDERVEAILVRINSPGGAVAPSQELYYALDRIDDDMPVAVSMGNVAASGGYYIAVGAEPVFANSGTITGSIGVITQFFNVERLVDRIDVEVHTVQSGEFKDAGSPFKPFEEEDEELFRDMVFDIHEQFVEHIADAREMEYEEIAELADGRVYTGRQAHERGLVDELGTKQDAVAHLADQAGLEDPELVYPPEDELGFLTRMLEAAVGGAIGEVEERHEPEINYEYVGPR